MQTLVGKPHFAPAAAAFGRCPFCGGIAGIRGTPTPSGWQWTASCDIPACPVNTWPELMPAAELIHRWNSSLPARLQQTPTTP